jgi:Bacterial PH domain
VAGGRPGTVRRIRAGEGDNGRVDVVTARPVRLRRVAIGIAVVVVVLFSLIAVLLGNTSSEGVEFGPGDQVAMVVLGLLIAAGVLLVARPAVVADIDGLRVRNIWTTKDVPWEIVRLVSFPDGSPWAMLELADDDRLAVLAVQASDGPRAVEAVRGLRALQARHAAGEGRGRDERSHGVM